MDALLLALLGCLAIEMGDKGQQLTLALAQRYRTSDAALIAGILCAAFANAALSAVAGWYLSMAMAANARSLFLALALLFGGAGLLFAARGPDLLENWGIGPFLTIAAGLFIVGFGDGAQFLLLGIATRTADPILTAIGGGIGIAAAMIPVALLRRPLLSARTFRILRIAAATIFLTSGVVIALTATGLA